MQKIFKCDRCGAYTYISATPGTVYAQPQCDCGKRMWLWYEEESSKAAVKEQERLNGSQCLL